MINYIIGGILILLTFLIIRKLAKDAQNNKCSCGHECSRCDSNCNE